MKKLILPIFILYISIFKLTAQNVSLGPDTILCPGQTLTLNAALTGVGGPGNPPPTMVTFPPPMDDCMANALSPIGFNFTFYGVNYTQCLISSNGYLQFAGTTPGAWSPYTPTTLPNTGSPRPIAAIAWQDTHPGLGGQVSYKTIGTAPNRVFIVQYYGVGMFGNCGQFCFGSQIKLYETSNIVEFHIANKASCSAWIGGVATQGLQNAAGTIGHVTPGRNNSVWTAVNDARRFTPTSPTAYTITTIPYSPSFMPATAPPAAQVTWTANGVPAGTGYSINVSPAVNTTYIVNVNSGSSGNCPVNVSISDTILVTAGVLPLATNANQTVCFGQPATIIASSPLAGVTYTWNPGGINNDSAVVTPAATTTYTVNATNPLGCTNSATVTVNVNPLPIPGVSPVNPQICQGSSVNMTASGGTSYVWSPGTGLNTTVGATVNAAPNATTPYTIVVTDANGCVDSMVNTVNFFPNPTVGASSVDPGVCITFNTQLNANGALNYLWSPAAGLSATNVANPVATPNVTTNYMVIGTDANSCVDTAYVNILVYPNPVAAFTAPVTAACQPLSVNLLDNSAISSGSITNYIWTVEGQGTSNLQNPSFVFTNNGDFDVTLVAVSDMGCTDTLTIVDYLHSYSVPVAGFYATPNPATLGDALVTFNNTSTLDAVNFVWDIDGLATISAYSPQYEFVYADTFLVTMIASTINGCSDTVSGVVIVEDVSEIWIPNSFTPNFDGLNESWFPVCRNFDTGNVVIDVEVFDRWGMSVFKSNDAAKPWIGKINGTASDCPQDVYVYRIYFQNEQGDEFTYSGHVSLIR